MNDELKVWLTTVDNPYDPFTEWDDWYGWDEAHGYCSCGLVARIALSSNELSEEDQDENIENAIDEICSVNASGAHRKVTNINSNIK